MVDYAPTVPEDEEVQQGLVPNPFTATQEQLESAIVRPTQFKGIQGAREYEPDRFEQLRNEEFNYLDRADHMLLMDGTAVQFSNGRETDRKSKLLQILENKGAYVPKYDENNQTMYFVQGEEKNDETGEVTQIEAPDYHTMSWFSNYEEFTGEYGPRRQYMEGLKPKAEPSAIASTVKDAASVARSAFIDRSGVGDLASANENLKALGVENEVSRSAMLRAMATGENKSETRFGGLQGVISTLLSVPKYGTQLARWVSADVVLELQESASLMISDDETKTVEKYEENRRLVNNAFELVGDWVDFAKHAGIQTIIEERSGKYYLPDVIEEIFSPRTVLDSAIKYGTEEGVFYSAYGAFKLFGAAKQLPHFRKFVTEEYGGESIGEGFANAFRAHRKARKKGKDTDTVGDILLKYQKSFNNEEVAKRAMKRVDTLLQLMSVRPSQFRNTAMAGEYDAIQEGLAASRRLKAAAVKTKNTKVVERESAKIAELERRRERLVKDNFIPKGTADAAKEMGLTTGFTVALTQLGQEFLGWNAENEDGMYGELAGAFLVAPVRFTAGKLSVDGSPTDVVKGTYRMLDQQVFSRMVGFAKSIGGDGKLFNMETYTAYRKGKKVSSQVSKFFKDLNKLPPEFQNLFLDGLTRQAATRDRLVELSAKTGIDVDADLMITNLAQMSEMAELIHLGQQLDTKIVATGLDDVAEVIVDRNSAAAGQRLLVAQMALASRQLLRLSQAANLDKNDDIAKLAQNMQDFVIRQNERLDADDAFISGVVDLNRGVFETMAKTVTLDADNPVRTVAYIQSDYNARLERLKRNVSPEILDTVDDPIAHLQKSFQELEEAHAENFAMISRIARSVRIEDADAGAASVSSAYGFAHKSARIDAAIEKRYTDWDLKNKDVHADVAAQFDNMVDDVDTTDPASWDMFLNEDSIAGKRLEGYKLLPATQRGFGSLFDAAAARSLEMMEKRIGEGNFKQMLGELELNIDAKGNPVNALTQWQRLRQVAKDPSTIGEGITLSGDVAKNLPDFVDMPLLVSAKEWRDVNKHLGRMTRNAKNQTADRYWVAYRDWQSVSDPASDSAFKRGWISNNIDDMPETVADEAYAEFRQAQDFYKQERVYRYFMNKDVKGFEQSLNGTRKSAETEEQFLEGFVDVPDERRPNYWLNSLFDRVKKESTNRPLSGVNLHSAVGNALGSGWGTFDEAAQEFRLVIDSANPEEFTDVETVHMLKAMITRHAQSILDTQFNKAMKEVNEGANVEFAPFQQLEYDKNLFESLFNIPVYARDESGNIVRAVNEAGEPRFLIDREEVFSVLDLTTMETRLADPKMLGAKRKRLVEIMDQADRRVQALDDAIERAGEYVDPRTGKQIKLSQKIRGDVAFVNDLQRELFGATTRGTAKGSALSKSQEEVEKAIYDKFVGGDAGGEVLDEIGRLKAVMVGRGYDANYIDSFIGISINNHIARVSQVWKGKTFQARVDGALVDNVPEYELNADAIFKMIGEPGSSVRKRMEGILGVEAVATWERIGDVVKKIKPDTADTQIDANIASMSLDSILSRIYNINRGVVSVQWVATESIIRAARMQSGALLKAMLSDQEFAGMILDVIETGKVPAYALDINSWRVLMTELMYQEGMNEAAISTPAINAYYQVTGLEPTMMTTQEDVEQAPQREAIEMAGTAGTPQEIQEQVIASQPAPRQIPASVYTEDKPKRTYSPAEQDLIKLGINPDLLKKEQ